MGDATRRFLRAYLQCMQAVIVLGGLSLWAAPPDTINIHGLLVDASGDPLPGDRACVVRFYDAEIGGAQLGGDLAGTVEVSPEGLFNLPVLLPPEALAAAEVWYELGIDTDMPPDGNAEDDIFPERVRVHSVPFAREAGVVAQLDADRIGDGTVDNTAFGHLAGVTQPIQAALDEKANNADLSGHVSDDQNPHGVTKAQVGLGNVDNTSDMSKPVSAATQDALDQKANNTALSGHVSDDQNPHGVTKAQLGLGDVDNTSDMSKPVSAATQDALDLKENTGHNHSAADITSGVFDAARIPTSIARMADVWQMGGNAGTSPSTQFLGTTDNIALELRVNNARAMGIVPGDASPNLIGGFSGNSITTGVVGATIGGGGASDNQNRVTDKYGVIGGGYNNQAGDDAGTVEDRPYATVGGGDSNKASGDRATVGGGRDNTASAGYATVGGGESNTASGSRATVGGGGGNTASGSYPTVGGGYNNIASIFCATVGGGSINTAASDYATVGGGGGNTASAYGATVGGGQCNTASDFFATVGGGYYNDVHASYGTIAGGGPSDTANPITTNNRVTGNFGAIGGGGNNQAGNDDGDAGTATYATVGGGGGNTASASGATVGGGLYNTATADYSTVGGGLNNTASTDYSTVDGGYQNTASGWSATVGGGMYNTATADFSTVGGGLNNTSSTGYSTVDGGYQNTASGWSATVGGGMYNTALDNYATVGGGYQNTALGHHATVGGGQNNNALGDYATVPGGRNNTASGTYSFAAGRRAKADHDGTFVWGDASVADVESSTANEFTARASGGVRFFTNTALTAGVTLAAGGSSWASVSDRKVKENFAPVDGVEVLEKVAALPISTWNYQSQDASIRHIGPMAQDVYAAFGVGESDTAITTIDADGIALAAIQGLNQRLKETQQSMAQKDREIAALRADKDREIAALRQELEAIKAMINTSSGK